MEFFYTESMNKRFNLWDKGMYSTSKGELELLKKEVGAKVGSCMSKWTKCPVNNGTCTDYVSVECYGFNPDVGGKTKKVTLCTLGCYSIDDCPLSK